MVVDAAAKCAAVQQQQQIDPVLAAQEAETQLFLDASLTNRQAWISAKGQSDTCKVAISHLKSGKVPTSKPGDLNNEI